MCGTVVSEMNTSHFLQPYDQDFNLNYICSIKKVRDALYARSAIDTRQVSFKLACGIYAFKSVTVSDITMSFNATGIFALDEKFPLW